MKVLFVCRQNVGRSQMAKAFYNKLTRTLDAGAAGTHVEESGQTLQERKDTSASKNFYLFEAMDDAGLDISRFTRTPLTEEMAKNYDLIVSMASKTDTPEWLLDSPKYVHWDVKDPRGQDLPTTIEVRDHIKARVQELLTKTK
jgi:arsenate reductase